MDCHNSTAAEEFGLTQVKHQICLFLIMITTGYAKLNYELKEFIQRNDKNLQTVKKMLQDTIDGQ